MTDQLWKVYKPFIERRPVDMRTRLQILQQEPDKLRKHMALNYIFFEKYSLDGDWITFQLTQEQCQQWQRRLWLTGRGFASAIWIVKIDPITKSAKARLW